MDIATALFDQDEVTRRTNLEIWNEGKDEGMRLGKDDGMRLGKDEGEKLERARIAKSLKAVNTSSEIIAQCTGLTLEQIEKL